MRARLDVHRTQTAPRVTATTASDEDCELTLVCDQRTHRPASCDVRDLTARARIRHFDRRVCSVRVQ
jgi:hypothetical protein